MDRHFEIVRGLEKNLRSNGWTEDWEWIRLSVDILIDRDPLHLFDFVNTELVLAVLSLLFEELVVSERHDV